jgi:ABC-2 type transport system permease protein/lipopolysaccharide transport system permease protein
VSSRAPVQTPVQRLRSLAVDEVPHLLDERDALLKAGSQGLGSALRQLWAARPIVRTIVERNLRVRYKQSFLGFAWALLTPVGLLCGMLIVFHRLGNILRSGDVPYPLFAYTGLLAWTFFSSGTNSGASSVLSDKPLLSKSRFPREVFPLSSVIVAAVDATMGLIPLGFLFVLEGWAPAATTPVAILPLLVLLAFTVGAAIGLSAVVVHLRDVRLALPIVVQIGLFLTPIAYGLDMVPAWGRLAYCFVNPVAPVIDSLRRTVLEGQMPQWQYLGAGAFTAAVVLVGAYALFKRLEGTFADVA